MNICYLKKTCRTKVSLLLSFHWTWANGGHTSFIRGTPQKPGFIHAEQCPWHRVILNPSDLTRCTELPCRSVTAKKLVEAGCYTLNDLKSGKFSSFLSVRQIAKIKYADHLECPAQRREAEEVLVSPYFFGQRVASLLFMVRISVAIAWNRHTS